MPLLRQAQGLRLQPRSSFPANIVPCHFSARCASNWSKHKRHRGTRTPQPTPASNDYDHDTKFDKCQKPFWKPITPDFITRQSEASSENNNYFANFSSFKLHASHKSGSEPIVEASSASWDSDSNQVKHTVYDPISGRMVPAANSQIRHSSTSAENKNDHQITAEKYQKPTILSQPSEQVFANTPTSKASFTEDFEKTYQSEHEELLAARRHLDALREQVQILERQAHPELVRSSHAVDTERPAVFEDGWDNAPQGLQVAFEHEKEACKHGEMEPLEQGMAALNEKPVQQASDDYSIDPMGMETLFAHEQEVDGVAHKSSLEQELAAMDSKAPSPDNPDSDPPKGLEVLFEQEQQNIERGERSSLEDEVKSVNSAGRQLPHRTGYADESTRLETMYDREQRSTPQRLEHELENLACEPTPNYPEDASLANAIGLETLYEKETAEARLGQRQSLEHELHNHVQARISDGSFSPNLNGMQTLWTREQEQVRSGTAKSLEDEINAQQQQHLAKDEYETEPFGLETSFLDETQGVKHGKSESLEEEVGHREKSQVYDHSYSHSPLGLETAFAKEEKEAILGNRQTLEQEMSAREPAFEDGYSTMPMGLQMMFRQEKQDHSRSLEEDLKQMEQASYHEDGYSRAPIGMEDSFERETKTNPDALETDLKNMSGEGDLSPTVGKFATSDKWYKQPSRSTFSEETLKANTEELTQNNPVSRTSLDRSTPDSIQPNIVFSETAAAADIPPTVDALENKLTDASIPQSPKTSITWAEPAIYKVVAYDSSKDSISITTTPSNFSEAENAISIPHAVSQLDRAARFIPQLAWLQNEGFQPIHAEKDFLILRKVHIESQAKSSRFDDTINPVDGTTKHTPIESPTARFASPTGFVNYEPLFTPERTPKHQDAVNASFDIPTYTHPEFMQQTHHVSKNRQHNKQSRLSARDRRARKEKRGRWRRRTAWLVSVAAGTAACTYVVGVTGELFRPEKHDSTLL